MMKIKEMSNRKSNKMVSKMVDNMGYHCFYKVRLNMTIMNILILTYIFRYFTAIYDGSKDRIFI